MEQMGVALEHSGTRTLLFGPLKGGADVHTLERPSLAMAWKPKQEQQHRSEDSLLGAECRISSRTQYAVSRITVESNAAGSRCRLVWVVAMPNGWPRCTTTATMMAADLSNKRKRRVPGVPATERSGRRSGMLWSMDRTQLPIRWQLLELGNWHETYVGAYVGVHTTELRRDRFQRDSTDKSGGNYAGLSKKTRTQPARWC